MKSWEKCSHAERIERWENAIRVLQGLSRHERRKHWNMGWWGNKTACGTVACAAGHCGLDPWFRERGLKMDFTESVMYGKTWWDTDFDSEDVERFFGENGTNSIFFRSQHRPVSAVIKEIKRYLKSLIETLMGIAAMILPAYLSYLIANAYV